MAGKKNCYDGEASNIDRTYYVKIPLWRKLAYGCGDLGNGFSWGIVTMYLSIFYTDIFLIPSAAVSVMFIICRLWDALNDILVGKLADRTNTKFGRFRPWILFGTVPLFIMTAILFWAHPTWNPNAKLVYAYLTYSVLVLLYTCVNLPYGSLNSVMTQDPDERSSLSGCRIMFASLGGTFRSSIFVTLLAYLSGTSAGTAYGYLVTVTILSLAGIILLMITGFATREVVPMRKEKKRPLSADMKAVWKNKPYRIILIGQFAFGFLFYGRMGVQSYWFRYVYGDMAAMAMPTMVGGLLAMAAAGILMPKIVAFLKSKGKAVLLFGSTAGTACIFSFFYSRGFDAGSLIWAFCWYSLGQGAFNALMYATIPDVVEYGEMVNGFRQDGFLNSFASFSNKVGMTVSTSGTTALLALLHYVPNVPQSAPVLTALDAMYWLIPGLMFIGVGILYSPLCYKLDNRAFADIVKAIQDQKRNEPKIDAET